MPGANLRQVPPGGASPPPTCRMSMDIIAFRGLHGYHGGQIRRPWRADTAIMAGRHAGLPLHIAYRCEPPHLAVIAAITAGRHGDHGGQTRRSAPTRCISM